MDRRALHCTVPRVLTAYEHHAQTGTTLYLFRNDLGIEGSKNASFVAGVDTVNQLMFPDHAEKFGIEYRMAVVDAGAPAGYRLLGDPFRGQMPPAIAISPSAKYAVSRETIADLRENQRLVQSFPVLGRNESFVNALTRYDPAFMRVDTGLVSRVMFFNLGSGERIVLDAMDGLFVAGTAVGEHWLSDTRVILANTFVPPGDKVVSGSARNEAGELLPVVAEYDLTDRSWRIIQRLEPALIHKRRVDRFIGMAMTSSGAVKVSTVGESQYYTRDREPAGVLSCSETALNTPR